MHSHNKNLRNMFNGGLSGSYYYGGIHGVKENGMRTAYTPMAGAKYAGIAPDMPRRISLKYKKNMAFDPRPG